MTDRELMQMALDALESECDATKFGVTEAIRARLAQPEPEPVAWFCELPDNKISIKIVGKPTEGNWKPLYTTPPQREWQGLTGEELQEIYQGGGTVHFKFALIETKLKEKNT